MKKFGLALAMLLLVAGAASATTCHIEIYKGNNLISLPNAPYEVGRYEPDYEMDFYNPYYIFCVGGQFADPLGAGPVVENVLIRPNATDKSNSQFANDWNMLLGEGYSYNSPARYTLTYNGVPDGIPDASGNMTDFLIPLPGVQPPYDTATEPNPQNLALSGGGKHLIGFPFAHQVQVWSETDGDGANVFFTDGTVRKTWTEAISDRWVANQFEGRDANTKSNQIITPDGAGGDFVPGRAYMLRTYKDNISMIIPAYPNNGNPGPPDCPGWDSP